MGRDRQSSHIPRRAAAVRALPAALQRTRENTLRILLSHLAQIIGNCDELFFDLSNRATSNNEQNLYFDSRQEIRNKKEAVLNIYQRQFRAHFEYLLRAPPNSLSTDEPDTNSLSLIEENDIEQEVAIASMVSKARANNQEALYHLVSRIRVLLPTTPITDSNNPLDPAQVCKAFSIACKELDLDIKARLIVLKQFDREVISNLSAIYEAANGQLAQAGILPSIRSTIRRNPTPPITRESNSTGEKRTTPNRTNSPENTSGYGIAVLTPLLARLRKLGLRPQAFIPAYSANPGPLIPQTELIKLLEKARLFNSREEDHGQQSLNIRLAIENIMASTNTAGAAERTLTAPDEDVINLVAMFFDLVLSDPSLPLSFHALIGRLQLPILKLALEDPGLFNNRRCPARLLIDEIARIGVGWDESKPCSRDSIMQTITEIVQLIHASPCVSQELFQQMRAQLRIVTEREESKAQLIETRTRESVSGQAKAKAARSRVQAELLARLKDIEVPDLIASFLIEQWQKVLLLTYLKQGDNNTEWLETLQLVDDLLWIVQDHPDKKSSIRRVRLLPRLRNQIHKGLSKTIADASELEAISHTVDSVLDALPGGERTRMVYQRLKPAQLVTLTQNEKDKSWKEMTTLERQQARLGQVGFEHIHLADNLQIGTWLLFTDIDTGNTLRGKLSAKLTETDSYIFVNRYGFKVLEKLRKDLALELQQKSASILDSRPLFERTMKQIAMALTEVDQSASTRF